MKIIDHPPFFMATCRRSGAHLLMSLLNSTKKIGHIGEHLYQAQAARANGETWTDAEVLDFFEIVYERAYKRRPNPTEHWGTKVDILDFFILERYLDLVQLVPQSFQWIWLRRRDKTKQAISRIRASKTDIWQLPVDSPPEKITRAHSEVRIERNELYKRTFWNFLLEEVWEQFFEQNEITPHVIYYEDFIEESTWESVVADIFGFLGVPYSLPLLVKAHYLKQSKGEIPESYKAVISELERIGIPLKYTPLDTKDEYELNLENR